MIFQPQAHAADRRKRARTKLLRRRPPSLPMLRVERRFCQEPIERHAQALSAAQMRRAFRSVGEPTRRILENGPQIDHRNPVNRCERSTSKSQRGNPIAGRPCSSNALAQALVGRQAADSASTLVARSSTPACTWLSTTTHRRADTARTPRGAAGIDNATSGRHEASGSRVHTVFTTRAGTPTTRVWCGTSRVTTDPAPTTLPSPTVTPDRTVTQAAIHAPRSMVTGRAERGPQRWPGSSYSCVSVIMTT